MKLIDKDKVVMELKRRIKAVPKDETDERLKSVYGNECFVLEELLSFLDTLEVVTPYEECILYDSIDVGIKAFSETYSFNIKSDLFPQLTKEQQELWRKEIEIAVRSGGECGVELVNDIRYKQPKEK